MVEHMAERVPRLEQAIKLASRQMQEVIQGLRGVAEI